MKAGEQVLNLLVQAGSLRPPILRDGELDCAIVQLPPSFLLKPVELHHSQFRVLLPPANLQLGIPDNQTCNRFTLLNFLPFNHEEFIDNTPS